MDTTAFDKLAEQLGSRYAAINYIARCARQKVKETNYYLLDSEAISWVITGEKPYVNERVAKRKNWYLEHLVDDVASQVDDEAIRASVVKSYHDSLQAHHLIYCYSDDLDEYQRARVRILTKMVWYNINQDIGG